MTCFLLWSDGQVADTGQIQTALESEMTEELYKLVASMDRVEPRANLYTAVETMN